MLRTKRTIDLTTEVDFDDLTYILATLPHEAIKELIIHLVAAVAELEFTKDLRDCFDEAVALEEEIDF